MLSIALSIGSSIVEGLQHKGIHHGAQDPDLRAGRLQQDRNRGRGRSGRERIANTRDIIVKETGRKFGDALEAVQQAAAEVLHGFRSKLAPDELELAFGLKFSGKVGVVLASTDAEATFTLKVKWANKAQA